MKSLRLTLSVFALVLAGALVSPALRADEEQDLLATLQSEAALPLKAEACKRLRLVGTPRSVAALGALLGHERLAQAARYALEGMPFAEATVALRQALDQTSGPLRTGVIDSLGWRHDLEAVPRLKVLLADPDPATASTAAAALARIGGASAGAALLAAREKAPAAVRPHVVDGLLSLAGRWIADGHRTEGLALYQSLAIPTEAEAVRMAAYAGWFRAVGEEGRDRFMAALKGNDHAAQTAALQSLASFDDPVTTRGLAKLLPEAAPGLQIALIAWLRDRSDEAVLPALVDVAARTSDDGVKVAALNALGTAGGADATRLLLASASSTHATEQAAARESLTLLRQGNVTAALAEAAESSTPPVRREAFRALAMRADPAAVPALLKLARSEVAAVRAGALQTLGQLGDGTHLADLVRLLVDAKDDEERDDVRGVFETLVERFGDTSRWSVGPILRPLGTAEAGLRGALFRVAALFATDEVRTAFRAALKSTDAATRDAAARALCTTRDAALRADLLGVAREAGDPKLRSLALEGVARLVTDETAHLPPAQQADVLVQAFELARTTEDRRTVLASLAHVPQRAALDLTERASADAAIRADAEAAALQIARAVAATEFDAVQAVLARLAAGAVRPTVKTNAQALLQSLDSGWLCAGPYRREGRRGDELFDVAFAPEEAGGAGVTWRRAPGTADLTRVGEVDLGGITGGDHCVVYAKTRVYVPEARKVVFSLGSDDGLKLWVNGALVHANNAVRGLTSGQDRATASLQAGWNELLAKVTQSTAGCGLSVRVLAENGGEVPGLKLDPRGDATR